MKAPKQLKKRILMRNVLPIDSLEMFNDAVERIVKLFRKGIYKKRFKIDLILEEEGVFLEAWLIIAQSMKTDESMNMFVDYVLHVVKYWKNEYRKRIQSQIKNKILKNCDFAQFEGLIARYETFIDLEVSEFCTALPRH